MSGRRVHTHWRYLGLVAAGGTVGTALRELLTLAVPSVGGPPLAIGAINVAGSFLLGALLEYLAGGPDTGVRRVVRLGVGTGLLGGFTTYSALSLDGVRLLGAAPLVGAGYALGSVLLGAVAAWAGIGAVRVLGAANGRR